MSSSRLGFSTFIERLLRISKINGKHRSSNSNLNWNSLREAEQNKQNRAFSLSFSAWSVKLLLHIIHIQPLAFFLAGVALLVKARLLTSFIHFSLMFWPGALWPALIGRKENPDGGILLRLCKSVACHLNQSLQRQAEEWKIKPGGGDELYHNDENILLFSFPLLRAFLLTNQTHLKKTQHVKLVSCFDVCFGCI